MPDKTFEIIKIGKRWVLRTYHTEAGYMPVCTAWVRIKANQKQYAISEMRKRGYCYQANS